MIKLNCSVMIIHSEFMFCTCSLPPVLLLECNHHCNHATDISAVVSGYNSYIGIIISIKQILKRFSTKILNYMLQKFSFNDTNRNT